MLKDFTIATAIVLAFIFDMAIWISSCVIAGFSLLFAAGMIWTGIDLAAYDLFEFAALALINSVIFYKIYSFFFDDPLMKYALRKFRPENPVSLMAAYYKA